MARATRQKKDTLRSDLLDGAQYWDETKVPADYMNGKDGKRPGQSQKPQGFVKVSLDDGVAKHAQLPPRSVWEQGEWKDDLQSGTKDAAEDYRTWIVSGEGTPGNYAYRHYVVPEEIAIDMVPLHPADWPKETKTKTGWGSQTKTGKAPVSKAPDLPLGIRFRCPGCGHWYKEGSLAGHSKVCPKDGEADWAIECECCHSLDETAKCKQGFPRKVVVPVSQEPDEKPKPIKQAEKKGVKTDGGGTSAA